MNDDCVNKYIKSANPLSDQAFEYLLNYKEEDNFLDYKVTFNTEIEKEWLGITKDIMAFANTYGGYLLFGISDNDFKIKGLNRDVSKILADADNVQKKINRYIEPEIQSIRSKIFTKNKKEIVGIFIPPSSGKTHVISKDGTFKHISGNEKIVLHKGTIYIRRIAGNHLANARDVDDIINRRLEYFKDNLLSNIAKVVEAPDQKKVVVLSKDKNTKTGQKYILSGDPEALPVKGLSFTTTPETVEEIIAAWVAISKTEHSPVPNKITLWEWFKKRNSISLPENQRIVVAGFCILTGIPPFFWLQNCSAKNIEDLIKWVVANRSSQLQNEFILEISAFLEKKFYNYIFKQMDGAKTNLRIYPDQGPRTNYHTDKIKRKEIKIDSEKQTKEELERELTDIVDNIIHRKERKKTNYQWLKWQAVNLDCYLYAQDKY